jgi:hypothetical protein
MTKDENERENNFSGFASKDLTKIEFYFRFSSVFPRNDPERGNHPAESPRAAGVFFLPDPTAPVFAKFSPRRSPGFAEPASFALPLDFRSDALCPRGGGFFARTRFPPDFRARFSPAASSLRTPCFQGRRSGAGRITPDNRPG